MTDDKSKAATAAEIYRLLPGKDCGEKSPCAYPKCKLFALAVVNDEADPYDCPYMEDEKRQQILLLLEDYFR